MVLIGNTEEVSEGCGILFEDKFGAKVEVVKGGDALRISEQDGRYKIEYAEKAGFFRGVSILRDKMEKQETGFLIEQKRNFDACGVMIDASRNAVPKVETVKRFLKVMAQMGLDMLMLYTEDTYKMEKYPYFGYMRGAYTQEEIREIVRFADLFGIEVVPCIQTLAHLSKPLRWNAFDAVRESADILFVGEDETYALIEEMIKTMRACFTTTKIHIGMDEANAVGLGAYLAKHGYTDRFEIMSRHLTEVLKIAEKYGFQPMMWSDMFFRLGSKSGGYYDLDTQFPENLDALIPAGITQVYWDYYHHSEKLYDDMLSEHKKMKRPIVFAGGIWIWGSPSVNYRQSIASTHPALTSCIKHGVKEVFATLWGDDGSECSVFQALYGLQLYAEYNYQGKVTEDVLKEMFRICTGCQADAFLLLDIDDFKARCSAQCDAPFGEFESYISTISKQALYQNPMLGLFDKNFAMADLKSHYASLLKRIQELPDQGVYEDLFRVHRQLVQVLTKKADLGILIKAAYDKDDRDLLNNLTERAADLACEFNKLHVLREQLWYQENKPFGFEPLSMRLKAAEAAVQRAGNRLRAYLNGEVTALEELEEERLYYNGIERPNKLDYFTSHIMTP